jgi:hypothetical protein
MGRIRYAPTRSAEKSEAKTRGRMYLSGARADVRPRDLHGA